jgi:4-amino-4-deoxy-L-arabinose transferase-like glycosyltransferase
MKGITKQSIRHANIGIGATCLIALVGAFAFRGLGEGALQMVGLVAFFSSFAVYGLLEKRARRKRRRLRQ